MRIPETEGSGMRFSMFEAEISGYGDRVVVGEIEGRVVVR